MQAVINNLLDTDLYKFTMMQVVLHHFPGARVEYRFKCRNPGIDLAQFATDAQAAQGTLAKLTMTVLSQANVPSASGPSVGTRKAAACTRVIGASLCIGRPPRTDGQAAPNSAPPWRC